MTSERGSKDDVCFAPKAAAPPSESGKQCGGSRSGADPLLLCECRKVTDRGECSTCAERNGHSMRCRHCPMVLLSADHLARHMSGSHDEHRSTSSSCESANAKTARQASRSKRRMSEKKKGLLARTTTMSTSSSPPPKLKIRKMDSVPQKAGNSDVKACGATVSTPGVSTFRCQECPKVYQSARSLKRHGAVHQRLVPCNSCTRFFNSEDEKREHVEECHRKSENGGQNVTPSANSASKMKMSEGNVATDQKTNTIGKGESDFVDESISRPLQTSSGFKEEDVDVAAAAIVAVKSSSSSSELVEPDRGAHLLADESFKSTAKKPSRPRRRAPNSTEPSLPMDTIVCAACQETYEDETAFAEHQRSKHGGAYPAACDICELQFPTPTLLRAHKIANHRSRRSRLTDEKDPFSRWYVYADEQKHLKCDQCNYNSLWYHKGRFLEHYRIHTGERPYTCDLCGKQFRTRTLMHKHVTFVHEGVKEHACDLCGRRFSDKRYMEDHRRIHTGERPYVCDLCGKTFKQSASLFIHKELHKGLRKHACDMCGKRFTTRSSLNIHIKRHVGERNFVCAICGKAFVDGKHLRDHSTVHSDERPFGCELCGARFKLMKHLKQHGRTHKRDFPG